MLIWCISEPPTVVYQISHSNGIHIGPDLNLTIVQNSPSAKAQPAPKENKIIRGLYVSYVNHMLLYYIKMWYACSIPQQSSKYLFIKVMYYYNKMKL
jgi:hypothetical protein